MMDLVGTEDITYIRLKVCEFKPLNILIHVPLNKEIKLNQNLYKHIFILYKFNFRFINYH